MACIFLPIREKRKLKIGGRGVLLEGNYTGKVWFKYNANWTVAFFSSHLYILRKEGISYLGLALSSDVLTQGASVRNEEFCLVVRYKKVHITHHRKKVGELTLKQQLKSKLKGFCWLPKLTPKWAEGEKNFASSLECASPLVCESACADL